MTLTVVQAVNRAPYFFSMATDQTLGVGETMIIFLPTYGDFDEFDSLTASITEEGGGSLPGFMSFD